MLSGLPQVFKCGMARGGRRKLEVWPGFNTTAIDRTALWQVETFRLRHVDNLYEKNWGRDTVVIVCM